MEDDRQQPAHLFVLRLWPEEGGEGQHVWRGAVKHLATGEMHYFRDWHHLISHLQGMLAYDAESPPTEPSG